MKDLTPTGQSYFDNQNAEYLRILKNAENFAKKEKEVCPICGFDMFAIKNGKRKCNICSHEWKPIKIKKS
jgi:formate dehydrogenase maturation protein FdhE